MKSKRKVSYYKILYRMGDNADGNISEAFNKVIDYIKELPEIKKKVQDKDKIFYLAEIRQKIQENRTYLLFKSAKHSFRPPLVNRNTLTERDNPKTIEEGEVIKTHLVIDNNSFDLVIENSSNAMTIQNIVWYFNEMQKMIDEDEEKGSFFYSIIPSKDFYSELAKLSKICMAEIFIDKKILGSPALNFNARTEEIREEVMLTLKPKQKGNSIKNFILNICNGNNLEDKNTVRRIRLKGKNKEKNEVILDTLNLVKKNSINVEKDAETGELKTESVFVSLSAII